LPYLTTKKHLGTQWACFITKLSSKLPQGYFNWNEHPYLAPSKTLPEKGKAVCTLILDISDHYNIPREYMYKNLIYLRDSMRWPYGARKSLWHHTAEAFTSYINLHKKEKLLKINAVKQILAPLQRKAAQRYFAQANQDSNPISFYTCRQCTLPLHTLHTLDNRLCSHCEDITCFTCFSIITDPSFKKICCACSQREIDLSEFNNSGLISDSDLI
jgi:hypothetical protein